jgi:hypothetical protein
MSDLPERPARPTRTKTRPVPPPDADVDPIDYKSKATTPASPAPTQPQEPEGKGAAPAPAAAAPPTLTAVRAPQQLTGGREVTVQLATRVSPDVAAMIDAEFSRTGRSKRALIEEAIRSAPWHTGE